MGGFACNLLLFLIRGGAILLTNSAARIKKWAGRMLRCAQARQRFPALELERGPGNAAVVV